jgi:predicted PolB exonuclease-like 3'-5' exonuclease
MIKTPINKILFLDIETVGLEKNYDDLRANHPRIADQFDKYFDWFLKRFPEDKEIQEDQKNVDFATRAALVPEFAKVVCVSVAFVLINGEVKKQSFSGDDENQLLRDCQNLLDRCGKLDFWLCGHNLKNFDIPMLAKRMLIQNILPPSILPSYDTKPWEVKAIDTKEVWQFGAYTAIGSLDLLCACMDVPSPKEGEVTGSKVHDAYWNKNMLKEITEYCERDVQVLVDVIQKLKSLK